MPRDLRAYLWDIAQAITLIEEFTTGKDFQDYESSALLPQELNGSLKSLAKP